MATFKKFNKDKNKELVRAFYEAIFIRHDTKAAAEA